MTYAESWNLGLGIFCASCLSLGAGDIARAEAPLHEAFSAIQDGQRPVGRSYRDALRRPAESTSLDEMGRRVDARLPSAGSLIYACMAVSGLRMSLYCEYGIRGLRYYGRHLSNECNLLRDTVAELGAGDQETPEDPGINQCGTLVSNIRALNERVRSGQMRDPGIAEATQAIASRLSSQIRAYRGLRRRAESSCRNQEERQALIDAWEALIACNVNLNRAFEEAAEFGR